MAYVRAVMAHQNALGDTYAKAPGDEYEADETTAANLIASGLAERVEIASPARPRRIRRSGK